MVVEYDAQRSALYTPERRDTLFEKGVLYSPLQLAIEAARLAYYRAEGAPAEMRRLSDALDRVGFSEPRMFTNQKTGAAAFGSVRPTDGLALLALRGTQPDDLSDIAHDLAVNQVSWIESAGRVHDGFALDTRSLLGLIRGWIDAAGVESKRLIVTGHSLGAAMATLIASVVPAEWLVTLGSPRVGDAEFLRTVKATNSVRIVDCCDVVTELPPPVAGYAHLPTRTYLTQDGRVTPEPAQSLVDTDRASARLRYLTEMSWRKGTVLLRDLADHAPINYARAFFN